MKKLYNISPLLNKYVLFNDIYQEITDLSTNHLFIVYDVINDDHVDLKNNYKYALQSVKIKKFEIWANISQIIILDEKSQNIARTLYGKL